MNLVSLTSLFPLAVTSGDPLLSMNMQSMLLPSTATSLARCASYCNGGGGGGGGGGGEQKQDKVEKRDEEHVTLSAADKSTTTGNTIFKNKLTHLPFEDSSSG